MPLYAYKCATCAAKRDIFKPLSELDRVESCHLCPSPMKRQITAAMVRPDLPGYQCPITEKWIEGRVQHEQNLKVHGCRLLEPGETNRVKQNQTAADEKLFDAIGDTAAKLVAEMPPEKQEKLANELDAGLDVSYSRA